MTGSVIDMGIQSTRTESGPAYALVKRRHPSGPSIVLRRGPDDEALYQWAYQHGYMRPGDWDEGGPSCYVLLDEYDVVPVSELRAT